MCDTSSTASYSSISSTRRRLKVRIVEDLSPCTTLSQNFRNIVYLQRSTLYSVQNSNGTAAQLQNSLLRYLMTAEAESELVDLIEWHEIVKCKGTSGGRQRGGHSAGCSLHAFLCFAGHDLVSLFVTKILYVLLY
jgi:hypothetical protein